MKTLRLYGAGLLVALLLTLAAHGSSSPDFTFTLNPTSLTVQQGSSGTTQLTITPQNGFTGTVSLSLVGAPSGVTLSPTSLNVRGTRPATQSLTVRVADHRPSRSGFQGASRMALATSSGVAPRLRRSRAWAVKRMGFSTPLA